jgi:hypothetical protein
MNRKALFSILLVYLFVFPLVGEPVIATPGNISGMNIFVAKFAEPSEIPVGPACFSKALSPQEAQNVIDLLKSGYTGKEIKGNTLPDTDRKSLDKNKIVVQDPNNEEKAVKVSVPNKKFKPEEASPFLNSILKGPFAFGVVLEDSLRAGVCKDPDLPACSLTNKSLKYRNSGSGIVADLKPMKEAIGDIYSKWFSGEKDLNGLSKVENEAIREAMREATDETQVKSAKRLETILIPNSILSDWFEAKMQTNCMNDACVISTYSLFDKYFNSWMSSEMAVSTFGPSLLYQTRKLFNWTGARGYFSGVREKYQELLDKIRAKLIQPESFFYNSLIKKINTRLDKYEGWREWWLKSVGGSADGTGYYIFKTEEFQHWIGEAAAPKGFFSTINTLEKKAEFVRMLKDMRALMRAGLADVRSARQEYVKAYNAALSAGIEEPLKDPFVREKYLNYGKKMITYMDNYYDEGLGADYIEWVARYNNVGLFDKGVRTYAPDGSSEIIDLFRDHRNVRQILLKLRDDGTFKDFEKSIDRYSSVFESRGDNLVLYTLDPNQITSSQGLSWSNIKAAAPSGTKKRSFIRDDAGRAIPYNSSSATFIQNRLSTNAQVLEGNWKEYGEISPVDMISRIDNARTGTNANLKAGVNNIEQMLSTLKSRNWVSRRYWNALDKLFAQEDELVRSYFAFGGGARLTALPFGYWWAKKGFGEEGLSMYMLPETWHDLKFSLGDHPIYDYAYIDFFANEGSDQGDLFIQILNKLPWKLVLDELSEKYNPVKNLYDALTKNELRSETENLAFYLTGDNECVNCTMVVRSQNMEDFRPFFFAGNRKIDSYIIEDTFTENAKNKGQTLIAFASHTNLVGKSGGKEGEPIDLAKTIEGKTKQKTCKEAVENLEFAGVKFGKIYNAITPDFKNKSAGIGFMLGGLESITYGAFFWAGMFSTIAIQVAVAPQLSDCVDTEQGYYAHYFAPVKETKNKQSNSVEKSTEKVSNAIKDFKEKFVESFKSDSSNPVNQVAENLGNQLDNLVGNAKDNDLVQANLKLQGMSSGQLFSRELFYVWCGEGCEIDAASYKQQGSEKVTGVNGSEVGIDFAKGEINENGNKPIVSSPDNVRLTNTNLNIPAIEIPYTVTEACLKNTDNIVFEISAQGNVKVLDKELLDCLQKGVLDQTGLAFTSDILNDVFGKLDVIVTDTYPNITPFGDRIIAEGVPRKVVEGKNAKITISANKDVNLNTPSGKPFFAGKLQSLHFVNGSIVVKPNGCFLTWLKHHEKGILNKDDVMGLNTKVRREMNEETGCEDPVIDFKILADPNSDLKIAKVESFNKALEKVGPFTVFETPTKRYIISAEKGPDGKCRDHLRVIDKETGKVTDYVGEITQTPNGLAIRTDDGQTHSIDFGEKDGAPTISFDKGKPETLISAQGKNGSFYYDPEKGLWFAENAQLLPLIEAFREGIAAKVAPNGEVTATAQGNVLNVDLGKKDQQLLDLPSLPEAKYLILLLFIALIATFYISSTKKRQNKKTKLKS